MKMKYAVSFVAVGIGISFLLVMANSSSIKHNGRQLKHQEGRISPNAEVTNKQVEPLKKLPAIVQAKLPSNTRTELETEPVEISEQERKKQIIIGIKESFNRAMWGGFSEYEKVYGFSPESIEAFYSDERIASVYESHGVDQQVIDALMNFRANYTARIDHPDDKYEDNKYEDAWKYAVPPHKELMRKLSTDLKSYLEYDDPAFALQSVIGTMEEQYGEGMHEAIELFAPYFLLSYTTSTLTKSIYRPIPNSEEYIENIKRESKEFESTKEERKNMLQFLVQSGYGEEPDDKYDVEAAKNRINRFGSAIHTLETRKSL